MKISVVIPSKDSPTLNETLRSIVLAADGVGSSSVETIVVDSSSAPVAEPPAARKAGLNLVIIRKSLGRLPARLLGFSRARGKWILNLDSDQVVHPDLLSEIVKHDRPAVVIPEVPNGNPSRWTRWERLVHEAHKRIDRDFRAHPSLDLPVIPRAYDRDFLNRAADAILDDAPNRRLELVPTRHEDTILFSYFLRVNHLSLVDSLAFSTVPIYHTIPDLSDTVRKYLRYGRDFGREARLIRVGSMGVDSSAWKQVYRVDAALVAQHWSLSPGWNFSGLVYDGVRGCSYIPGIVGGYLRPR
jgi:glycosyltransferase involved in cell wall biosynthesis